jgi:hypothetical protein
MRSMARLELAGEMVPSLDWFIYALVRKEAVAMMRGGAYYRALADAFLEYMRGLHRILTGW